MTSSKSKRRDLRLEMRVKNNVLWRAIHDLYPTVSAFCRTHDLYQTEVGKLISFKASPFTKAGEYRVVTMRLSEILGITQTELFPPKLYANMLEIGSFKAVEVSSFAALPRATQKEIRMLPAPAEQIPDVICMRADHQEKSKEAINEALEKLSYLEREVIKLRYGLNDGNTCTLNEVGHTLRTTREHVRQIEAKAIRKLQQPSRSQILVDFLD